MKFLWKEKELYINEWLARTLDSLVFNVRKDWDFVLLITGDRGVRVGKCLEENTKLLDGKRLNEYEDGETINTKSYDFKKGKIVDSKSKIECTGVQDVYEVELMNGKKVLATENHKFFILKNHKIIERELKNIKEGDRLICVRQ